MPAHNEMTGGLFTSALMYLEKNKNNIYLDKAATLKVLIIIACFFFLLWMRKIRNTNKREKIFCLVTEAQN